MKTTITFETQNVDELKRIIAALPSGDELKATVLYGVPDLAAGTKAELERVISDRNFWKAQATRFAKRIQRDARRAKKVKQ